MDGLTLGFVARELHNTLSGGRIDRISQPDKDLVLLMIRTPGENHRLLVAAGRSSDPGMRGNTVGMEG